jgi:hypothetical protein
MFPQRQNPDVIQALFSSPATRPNQKTFDLRLTGNARSVEMIEHSNLV